MDKKGTRRKTKPIIGMRGARQLQGGLENQREEFREKNTEKEGDAQRGNYTVKKGLQPVHRRCWKTKSDQDHTPQTE